MSTRRTTHLAALAAVATTVGYAVIARLYPMIDALPAAPGLSRMFGWSPAFSLGLAAAGALRLSADRTSLNGRRLLAAGAVLALLAALFPQVTAGELTLPLVAAWRIDGIAGAFVVALALLGFWLLSVAIDPDLPKRSVLRGCALGLVAFVPGWCLVRGEAMAALPVAAFSSAFTWAAYRLVDLDVTLVRAGEWCAVVAFSAFFWLLKLQGLGYSATDEGIYFYAAKIWSEGVWPYRDFFFSHPPIHLVIPMLVYKLLGFSWVAGKLIPPLAGFGAGLVLWRMARKHFGVLAGLATLGFYWLSVEMLWSSTTFTGAETATLFLCLGLAAALDRRVLSAGVWFGLASATAVYASSGFLAFAALLWTTPRSSRWTRHDAVRLIAAFALTFGGINLLFLAIGGERYIDGVFRYHLLKAARDSHHQVWSFLAYHMPQCWFAALAPALLAARRWCGLEPAKLWPPRAWWESDEGRVPLLALSAAAAVLVLSQLNEIFDHYFMILLPTLAPLCGFTVRELVRWGDAMLSSDGPARAGWLQPIAALALACLWLPLTAAANATAFPEEFHPTGTSKGAGEVVTYDWTPAPVLPALGDVVRRLFWEPSRVRGSLESSVQSYLTSKKRSFSEAPEIAEYVRNHTDSSDTITGGSDYAPIIALLADRRLAGNQVDTNSKVFRTGVVPEQKFWQSVCADHLAYVVSAEMSYFAAENLPNLPVVSRDFVEEKTFEDRTLKFRRTMRITLLRRRNDPPQPACSAP